MAHPFWPTVPPDGRYLFAVPSHPRDIEIVRDPLWDNIRLDADALAALDTPAMQRLRYVRQLGQAFLVYPGANHSRFEHALGAYHLARRALVQLQEQDEWAALPDAAGEAKTVRLAALLHDVGHYPFSHSLEEAGFGSHETIGVQRMHDGELGAVLRATGGTAFPARIGAMVTGESDSPLAGLISGSLDLDKIDYLSRDARNCGVPYGTVDVDRLLASLTLVQLDGRWQVGVLEKGMSALESLLFAKYQMYRNVYWHHAVRAATCMFKRAVRRAAQLHHLSAADLADATDDGLMERLTHHEPHGLAARLRARRLHKRALDLPASSIPDGQGDWIDADPDLLELVEDALARELGLAPGDLLLDYPARRNMLSVDLPLRTRDGRVERLTDEGRAGALGLPRVAGELYGSARRLRLFTAAPIDLAPSRLLRLLDHSSDDLRGRIAAEVALLG